MAWNNKGLKVIFPIKRNGTKRIQMTVNINGPTLREEKKFSTRQFGGGSIKSYGCFSFNDVDSLVFLSGKVNSKTYLQTLYNHFSPVETLLGRENGFISKIMRLSTQAVKQNSGSKKKNNEVWQCLSINSDLNHLENL